MSNSCGHSPVYFTWWIGYWVASLIGFLICLAEKALRFVSLARLYVYILEKIDFCLKDCSHWCSLTLQPVQLSYQFHFHFPRSGLGVRRVPRSDHQYAVTFHMVSLILLHDVHPRIWLSVLHPRSCYIRFARWTTSTWLCVYQLESHTLPVSLSECCYQRPLQSCPTPPRYAIILLKSHNTTNLFVSVNHREHRHQYHRNWVS